MLSSSLFRLLIWAFIVLFHRDALAQIPAVCVNDYMLQSKQCCPIAENGMQCGGPNQGECKLVSSVCKTDYISNGVLEAYADLRFNWPIHFFDGVCVCKNNFGDFDCGRCKFGYESQNGSCAKSPIRMRMSVQSMTSGDWVTYNMRLNQSKYSNSRYMVLVGDDPTMVSSYSDISVYNLVVWMHHYAARTDNGMLRDESRSGIVAIIIYNNSLLSLVV